MNLMQPKMLDKLPLGPNWYYEIKYDGFRAELIWSEQDIRLKSRRGTDLTVQFPEVIEWCKKNKHLIISELPIVFDGELVILNTKTQANFSLLQKRGRMRAAETIMSHAMKRPAHFLCFDLLTKRDKSLRNIPYLKRKEQLYKLFEHKLRFTESIQWKERLGYVTASKNPNDITALIFENLGEGIIAKQANSIYQSGKTHHDWFKIKNWRTITGFITAYNLNNGYFSLAVYKKKQVFLVGKWKHGMTDHQSETLLQFVKENGNKDKDTVLLPPAICVDIDCLGILDDALREPMFNQFRFDIKPEACTYEKLQLDIAMISKSVELTNQHKRLWVKPRLNKVDLLRYIRLIAPYMLPFLQQRALTIIRCPDGVNAEAFFQKNAPDYAPSYIIGKGNVLSCDSVEGLIWLANHGTIEYHIPFQYINQNLPNEIVFDLDPSSIDAFSTSVYAAQLLKVLFDQLGLISFVKTSGSKGLQVHIPITVGCLTYEETGKFTKVIAHLLERKYPDLFTTERMKKNRKKRLYLDYVQHGQNKTLIAPYSPRKTEQATVATPLFWDELTDNLSPDLFTIENVIERVWDKGCPFSEYHEARLKQPIEQVKNLIE